LIERDLLHPNPVDEKRKHKKHRLVQSPNSYFMDVKCPGCFAITTVFRFVFAFLSSPQGLAPWCGDPQTH